MMRVGGCVCAKDHAITERRVKRKEETLRGTNDDTSRVTFEKRRGGEGGKACEYAIKSISRLLFSLALAAQDRIRFKRCQEEGEDGGKGLCHLPLFDVHFASASASDMMQLQQAKAL